MYNINNLPDKFKGEATLQYGDEVSASFLETSTYTFSISKDMPVLFILGNKGAGKSAVLGKIYADNSENTIVIYFKDFYNEIDRRVKQNLSGQTDQQLNLAYEKEWEIELWIQIIIHLYRIGYRTRRLPFDMGDRERLYQFLKKHRLPMDKNLPSEIAARISNIRLSIPGFSVDVKSEEGDSKAISQYEFNKIKEHAINILGKLPIFLLFDEFDSIEKWDESVRVSIRGLVEAIFTLVRDVNKVHRQGNNLVARIAIRDDMFNAAKIRYVHAQKIPRKGMDLAWSRENLEELVARKIKVHWGLESSQIHRGKIIYEVFPVAYNKRQDVFGYLCVMARLNPRALFSILRDGSQSALDRKQAFIPSDRHYPMYIGGHDIQVALESYLDAQTEFVVDANAFLYQELENILGFFEDVLPSILTNNYIKSKDLRKSLQELLDDHPELSEKVLKWPAAGYNLPEKLIRVMYEIGVLGIKKSKNDIFSPSRYIKSSSLTLHPAYKPLLLERSRLRSSIDPIKEVQGAKNEVSSAIDHLTNLITPGRRTQVSSRPVNAIYSDKDIVHGAIRLIWSIRLLLKKIIAYSDDVFHTDKSSAMLLIRGLEKSFSNFGSLFRVNGESLHLLAILYNPSSFDDWRDGERLHNIERFEDEMNLPEHEDLFNDRVQMLYRWVGNLLKDDRKKMATDLDLLLLELRDNLNLLSRNM